MNNNDLFKQSNSVRNYQFNSFSSRRKKFSNHYIFMKREILYNKSLEENKATFKYHNYSLFEKKRKINSHKKQTRKKLIESKSSLYLTESILKTKNFFFL